MLPSIPSNAKPEVRLNLDALQESIYGCATFEKSKQLLVMAMQCVASVAKEKTDLGEFWVQFSLVGQTITRLGSYGTLGVPEAECPLLLGNTAIEDVCGRLGPVKSYFGARVLESLAVSFATTRLLDSRVLKSVVDAMGSVFSALADQLVDLDNAEQSRARERAIEEQTHRFLRHEIKNGIIASLADVDSVRESMQSKVPKKPPVLRGLSRKLSRALSVDAKHFKEATEESDLAKLENAVRDLGNTMETLLSSTMVSDVLAGVYKPRRSRVDVGEICAGLHAPNGITVSPARFVVKTDPQLVRFVVTNAVSNAVKYGDRNSPVRITFEDMSAPSHRKFMWPGGKKYQRKSPTTNVRIVVSNDPGPGHAKLMQIEDHSSVFEQGTRFHGADTVSAGDGAWIMQQCAKALQGHCKIAFEPVVTRFQFQFKVDEEAATEPPMPAQTSQHKELQRARSVSLGDLSPSFDKAAETFALPKDAFLVALEDGAAQRRVLQRAMVQLAGDNIHVFGDDVAHLDVFVDKARTLIRESPSSHFVFFLDDNLHYTCDDGTCKSASGVQLGKELRAKLVEDEAEDRVLLLARTSDDDDAAIAHNSRILHGHFPKCAVARDTFKKELAVRWLARFGGG